jgi:hypothetical protein
MTLIFYTTSTSECVSYCSLLFIKYFSKFEVINSVNVIEEYSDIAGTSAICYAHFDRLACQANFSDGNQTVCPTLKK